MGTIVNDDVAAISIADAEIAEGDSGSTALTFTISTDLQSSKDLSVTVDTADLLEAIAGTDYVSISNATATINAGDNFTTVTVDLMGDLVVELDETFNVEISAAQFDGSADTTRVNIADNQAVGTIVNDDSALLSIDDVAINEDDAGNTTFTFTVSTDLSSSKDLGVTVDTADLLEAVAGNDYTAISGGSATILAGTDSTTVTVNVTGDQLVEIDETFAVDITAATFDGSADTTRVNVSDSRGVGTILNDDSASLSIDDVAISEGDTGTTTFTFTVSTDLRSSKDLGVTVNTADLLEAVAGTDYTAISGGTATIAAGTDSTTVTVDVVGEQLVELDETFAVNITSSTFNGSADSTRVNIVDNQGIGTIINDDSASLSIDDVAINEGDAGTTTFTFTISTDLRSSKDLGVAVNTADLIEAVAGTDYTAIAGGSATIIAGTDSTTVDVAVQTDRVVEIDESFNVIISASTFDGNADSTRVNIGDNTGVGTIINDDTAAISIDDAAIAEGDAGNTALTFTISTDLRSSKDLSVTVNTADLLEAVGGTDYVSVNNATATIAAGTNATNVTVDLIGDRIVEVDETFTVDLSSATFDGGADATRVNIADNQAIGTITNDDAALLSIDDVAINEGDAGTTTFTFTVSTDLRSSKDLGVNIDTANLLEAVTGTDYTAITGGSATIAAGNDSTTVAVAVMTDRVVEIDETFNVIISAASFNGSVDTSRVNIADDTGVGTIINDDVAAISIADAEIAEGDSGSTALTFTISTDLQSSKDLSVTVDTADLFEAIAGTDYVSISNATATINAGDNFTTVTVDLMGDLVVEIDETFNVNVSAAQFDASADTTRVNIADNQAVGTIANDDSALLSIDDVAINEGGASNTTFTFTVSTDLRSSKDLSVTVNTADLLEAVAGNDYTAISGGTATILAGTDSTTLTVSVIGDQLVEIDESFAVDITSATFSGSADNTRVNISDNRGVGTIVNDDAALLSINDVAINEGDTGTTTFTFTVSTDLRSSKDLGVTIDTADLLEAVAGIDYTAISGGSATIAAGTDSTTVTVDVVGEQLVELDETFAVDISSSTFNGSADATRVNIGDNRGVGTIINDDSASVSIDDVAINEGDAGTTIFTFTISTDLRASKDLSVGVDTADLLEAVAGTDYTAISSGSATIVAGTDSTTVDVAVQTDRVVEVDETFNVNLSASTFNGSTDTTRVNIVDDTGVGTIINDDTAAISISDVAIAEGDTGNTAFTFTISTDLQASKDLSVNVNTADLLEAVGGTDYVVVENATATIIAGTDATSVTVDVIGDQIVEVDETFTVNISAATFDGDADATRVNIADNQAVGTIINDDAALLSIDDVAINEGDTGTTTLTFTISTDLRSSKDLGVTVDTADLLEAVAGTDYTAIDSGSAIIAAGTDTTTVDVIVRTDRVVEIDETFNVILSDSSFAGSGDTTRVNIADDTGVGTIINDDVAAISIGDAAIAEGDTGTSSLTFTISTDLLSSKDLSVTVDTADLLEAVGGTDYTVISNATATIIAGTDSTTVTVNLIGDQIVEVDETFTVDISSARFDASSDTSRVNITDSQAVGTIVNDDSALISIDDVAINEGDSGNTTFTFTISTDLRSSKDLGVAVNTADLLEAVAGVDYTAINSQLAVISAGTDSTTIDVNVQTDRVVEIDETFTVNLTAATFGGSNDTSRVNFGKNTGVGTIINDDVAAISINDASIAEGDSGPTSLTFTISTDLRSSKDLQVTVDTDDLLEAIGGTDYTSINNATATILAGTDSTTFTVDVIGDRIVEVEETFTVEISDARFDGSNDTSRATIDTGNEIGTGTIINDDTAAISVDDVSLVEGDDGSTTFTFTISSDLESSKDLQVLVDTNDLLEAVAGTDYIALTGQSAVISAGTTSTSVDVTVLTDRVVEIDETFTLDLSAATFDSATDTSRVTIADATGVGTIVNDDSAAITINDATMAEGDSGQTTFTFTVTSDLTSSKDLEVTVNTNDALEAIAGTDYTALSNQIAVIAAGTDSTVVTIDVAGDEIVEVDETFTVDISSAKFDGAADSTRVNISDSSGLGTITNDDAAEISINDITLNESDAGLTEFVFTISTDLQSSKDLAITVNTSELLDAESGIDFTAITDQTAIIAAGTDETTVTVNVIGDRIVEIDETFAVDISAATFEGATDSTRANIGADRGIGTIANDDTATISIEDATIAEGDSGQTQLTFTIASDLQASRDLQVTVDTNDLNEAVAGSDYAAINAATATISAGSTTTTVTVDLIGDEIVEVDETFTVDISNAVFDTSVDSTRVNVGDGSAVGTIVNDDSAALSIDDVTLSEGDAGTTTFAFTVTSDSVASKDLTVLVNTNDLLEAVAGTDYAAVNSQLVTIEAGQTTATIEVDVLSDRIVELDEIFTTVISAEQFDGSNDASRVTIADDTGLGTIVNDDTASLSIDDVALNEGDSGQTMFTFTITSDLEASKDLDVTVNTNDLLEAIGETDYASITDAAATISAGQTTTTITVDVTGDSIVEVDETFTVDVSNALFDGNTDTSRVNVSDSSGLGTIVNDDTAALTIDDVSLVEGDAGTTDFVFTISSDALSSKDLTAVVNTVDLLEAVGGSDYTVVSDQTVSIAAGQTSTSLTVQVLGDEIVEVDETFTVNLSQAQFDNVSDATRVVINDSVGLGTIINDDLASITINDVTLAEGNSGQTAFVFTVSSDSAASKDLGVLFDVQHLGDSIGGLDLTELSMQPATIDAGATSTTVTINVNADTVVELDETFEVNLSSATFDSNTDTTRVQLVDTQAIGTIINDDTATLSVNDVSVVETDDSNTTMQFTVSMDNVSSRDTTLTVRSQDGMQAIAGDDYLAVPNQDLVIAAGQTSATLSVEIIGDEIVEIDETVNLVLSDALFDGSTDSTRIVIGDDIGIGTIINNDTATITIEDVTVIEGDLGSTDATFTLTQDAVASQDTTVTINTVDLGDALGGIDFNEVTNQVVTIEAGERTATFSIGIIGEELVEATETFRVDLSAATFDGNIDITRITISDSSAIAEILNDDAGSFVVEDLIVNESDETAELVVSISSPIDVNTTLDFSLDVNDDIQNLDSQITFRAGASQSQSIRFAITDDLLVEGTENYIGFFELMTRSGGRDITATVAASIDILDNDRATFTLSDLTVDEASGTATLSIETDSPFDIDATFDLVDDGQNDITFLDSSATFAAGSTESQEITVEINDDQLVEIDELINVTLAATTDLGDRDIDMTDTGQLEIIDNDTATFTVEDLFIVEGDGTVAFTVSVDNPIDIDTTLGLLLSENDDLIVENQSITFAAGSSQSQDFEITVVDDNLQELTERFETLVNIETDLGTRSVNAPEIANLTIKDNDTPEFLQNLNEAVLINSVPFLVPTTAGGGGSVGGDSGGSNSSGSDAGNSGNSTTSQTASDSAASDGSPDAAGAEDAGASEPIPTIVSRGGGAGGAGSQSSSQSLSSSDGGADYEESSSSGSKNVSSDSEYGSDDGELFFHVVLPNGKLGKKFELDIELLNDASLFERFRGLPTDVYRVMYREPGSDTFQQLFEIYVVDGKIETILYSPNAPIEKIDPADDLGAETDSAESTAEDAPIEVAPVPEGREVFTAPLHGKFGRLAGPMVAASIALSMTTNAERKTGQRTSNDDAQRLPKMDRVSRALRRIYDSLTN